MELNFSAFLAAVGIYIVYFHNRRFIFYNRHQLIKFINLNTIQNLLCTELSQVSADFFVQFWIFCYETIHLLDKFVDQHFCLGVLDRNFNCPHIPAIEIKIKIFRQNIKSSLMAAYWFDISSSWKKCQKTAISILIATTTNFNRRRSKGIDNPFIILDFCFGRRF